MKIRNLLAIVATCCTLRAAESPTTIQVHAGKKASAEIPRTVFGTFLEPIGKSIYGGLWAELLTNPSFENGLWSADHVGRMLAEEPSLKRASALALPLPWEPLDERQGNRYEPRRGDALNSWQSMAIFGVPGKATGIRQKIYLPTHRTREFRGSLYVKHISGSGQLKLSLRVRNEPANKLAETVVQSDAADWKKYDFTLNVKEGSLGPLKPVDFAIELEGDERVLLDQVSLMPADAHDGFDPDAVRFARELKTPLLRFGGNFTSAYHWRDGVGPRDKRVSMTNISWGLPEYNTFGTDEFLRFCDLIDAEPQIALNLGSGSSEEAAEWVRYVYEHGKKKSGLTWELGNELWGNWNLANPTVQELPQRTLTFSRAVHAVDPTAKLIATGQDPDHFTEWNAAQLTNPADTFQYLATHFVVTTNNATSKNATEESLAAATFALPVELGRQLRAMQKQIDSTRNEGNRPHLAFTEWLFACCKAGSQQAPSFRNMGGAVAAGGFMNMLLTHSDVVPISDMTGLMEFTGIWKKRERVFAAPSYYAFQMYSTADIDHVVSSENNAGVYQVKEGISRLPDIENVANLDVVAAVNKQGDRLTLFCINRQLKDDITASIALSGFSAKGKAIAKTLKAASVYEENTDEAPERVIPQQQELELSGNKLNYMFPHESVTRIELQK